VTPSATAAQASTPANAALMRHKRGATQKNRLAAGLVGVALGRVLKASTARLNRLGLTPPPCQECSGMPADRAVPLALHKEATVMGKHDNQVSF
jgi:hypothetical protein